MTQPAAVAASKPHGAHEAHHEELGFWRKYVFSVDHKVIGIQYAVTGLLFLLFGFALMMLMRWHSLPGAALPLSASSAKRGRGGTMLQTSTTSSGRCRHDHGIPGSAPRRRRLRNFVLPLRWRPDMASRG